MQKRGPNVSKWSCLFLTHFSETTGQFGLFIVMFCKKSLFLLIGCTRKKQDVKRGAVCFCVWSIYFSTNLDQFLFFMLLIKLCLTRPLNIRSGDFNLATRNPWFSSFLVSSNLTVNFEVYIKVWSRFSVTVIPDGIFMTYAMKVIAETCRTH